MSLDQLRSTPPALAKPRRTWSHWFFPLLLGAIVLAFLLSQKDRLLPALQVRTAAVQMVELKDGESLGGPGLEPLFVAPGWAEARPFAHEAAALVAGTLKEVRIIDGQKVQAGEVLATLVDEEFQLALEAAQEELLVREAQLAAREPRIAMIKAETEGVKASIRAEEAVLSTARDHLQLLDQAGDAVSAMDRLHAHTAHREAEAKVDALRSMLPVKQAQLLEADKDLLLLKQEITSAKVAVRRAQLDLARTVIPSPITGIVLLRRAQPGQRLMPDGQTMVSASVAEIYDPAKLQVRADVPLSDAARLLEGQQALVSFDLLPERKFKALVSSINGSADLARNTLQCKVSLSEHDERLRAEMIAKVTFLSPPAAAAKAPADAAGPSRQRFFIPKQALTQPHKDHFVVWVFTPEGKANSVTVTLGRTERASAEGPWIEISSGLLVGQRVVISPPAEIKQGVRLRE